jgi:hypothetical protein
MAKSIKLDVLIIVIILNLMGVVKLVIGNNQTHNRTDHESVSSSGRQFGQSPRYSGGGIGNFNSRSMMKTGKIKMRMVEMNPIMVCCIYC